MILLCSFYRFFSLSLPRNLRLSKGVWLTSLDLKNAYWHVPIHPRFRRFLAFQVGSDTFKFSRLPFGLSIAPRVLTKLTKVVAHRLVEWGVTSFMYLDDWLVFAQSKEQATISVRTKMGVLKEIGMLINLPKSKLIPTQEIDCLGIRWSTTDACMSLTPDNAHRTLSQVRRAYFSKDL